MPSDRARESSTRSERQSGVFGQVGDLAIVAVSAVVVLAGVATLVVWGVPSLIDAGADAPPAGASAGNGTDAPDPRPESTAAGAPTENGSGGTGTSDPERTATSDRTPTATTSQTPTPSPTPTPTPTAERSNETPAPSPGTDANASGKVWHDLRLVGESGQMESYAITVSGELRQTGPPDPNDDQDAIGASGRRVTGEVGGGADTYEFTGSVTRIQAGGNTTVYVDGRPVAGTTGGGAS